MSAEVCHLNDEDTVNFLIYQCYKYNRKLDPNIPIESWGKIFKNVKELEKKYQQENLKEKNI